MLFEKNARFPSKPRPAEACMVSPPLPLQVWDLVSAQCVHTATGHNGAVMSMLLWSNHIISCALDGTVKARRKPLWTETPLL